jgi:hypothetical protein
MQKTILQFYLQYCHLIDFFMTWPPLISFFFPSPKNVLDTESEGVLHSDSGTVRGYHPL